MNDYEKRALALDMSDEAYAALATDGVSPIRLRRLHGAIGAAGEAGEIADLIKKQIYGGKPLDGLKVLEEVGDCLWYLTLVLSTIGCSLADAMRVNIAKLETRYPDTRDKYTTRNEQAEKQAMLDALAAGEDE